MAEEYVTRDEFENTEKRLSRDIRENREHIEAHSKDIVRLDTLYKSLEGLPDAIIGLDKTLLQMSNNMEAMNRQMEEQKKQMAESIAGMNNVIDSIKSAAAKRDEKIDEIDNKSKVDWQKAITNNFWKILAVAFGAYTVIELGIKLFGG